VRVFKTTAFAKFTRKKKIKDVLLCEAVERAERGLIDADLGEGLIKQRIPRPNEGRSGGYRAIIAYQVGDLTLFIYGFSKNDKENIDAAELKDLHELANLVFKTDDDKILELIETEEWIEVICNE
jgi:hypothetical protein